MTRAKAIRVTKRKAATWQRRASKKRFLKPQQPMTTSEAQP